MVEAAADTTGKLGVFISYSREDLAFADQLDAALKLTGFATALDRHGISGGEDWNTRLGGLIRAADTVVFVVSPASAISKTCAWEVSEAVRLGKRILPVVCELLGDTVPPKELAALNYIFFCAEPKTPNSGFGTGLATLVAALNTDLDWLREHTRLLQRAVEWDAAGRAPSRLLFGDSIAAAQAWVGRRTKNAPEPTALHFEFLRASEEAEAQRQNAERKQLELMAAAQAERANALSDKEEAQKREAVRAKQVVRRTFAGLAVALAFAAVAAVAGWNARLRSIELEAQKVTLAEANTNLADTNRRLGTEMKLRVAPFGKDAYSISEQWYKLATTNASSIAFIETPDKDRWMFLGTGFLVRGKDLYAPWGDELLLVTAGHVRFNANDAAELRIYFPAIDETRKVKLGDYIWRNCDPQGDSWNGIDAEVIRLADKLPPGARHIDGISDLDVASWKPVKLLGDRVQASVLPKPFPLITLGAAVEGDDAKDFDQTKATGILTLSLANALGRDARNPDVTQIIFTDSTTIGGSGSPVFDAEDGRLVAIVQYGSDRQSVKEGLAFSGGVTLNSVKKAIAKDMQDPLAWGLMLLKEGNDTEAKAQFAHALERDPAAGKAIGAAYASRGKGELAGGKQEEARTAFELALTHDASLRADIDAMWTKEYLSRGRGLLGLGKDQEAAAQFALVLSRNPSMAKEVDGAWAFAHVVRGRKLLQQREDKEAEAEFAKALARNPSAIADVDTAWAKAFIDRGGELWRQGKEDEAEAQFKLALQRKPDEREFVDGRRAQESFWRGSELLQDLDLAGAKRLFAIAAFASGQIADQYRSVGLSMLEKAEQEPVQRRAHLDLALTLLDEAVAWERNSQFNYRRDNLLGRVRVHAARQEHAKAMADYAEAIRLGTSGDGLWQAVEAMAKGRSDGGDFAGGLLTTWTFLVDALPALKQEIKADEILLPAYYGWRARFGRDGVGMSVDVARLYAQSKSRGSTSPKPSACDRLAGSSIDPFRVGEGVAYDKIDAAGAVAACSTAIREFPGEARYLFQRGLAHGRAADMASEADDKEAAKAARTAQMADLQVAMDRGYPLAFYAMAVAYNQAEGADPDKANSLNVQALNRVLHCCWVPAARRVLAEEAKHDRAAVRRVVREVTVWAARLGSVEARAYLAELRRKGIAVPAELPPATFADLPPWLPAQEKTISPTGATR